MDQELKNQEEKIQKKQQNKNTLIMLSVAVLFVVAASIIRDVWPVW